MQSPPATASTIGAERNRRLLSTRRLKVILTVFVLLLLVVVSGLIFALVARIFGRLTPSMEDDLVWKTKRGAQALAQAADLGLAAHDGYLVEQAFGDYRSAPDVLAIVAFDPRGDVLTMHGQTPEPPRRLITGPPATVRAGPHHLVAWAESKIEGILVGYVALVVSTARLEQGERLRHDILAAAALGCLAALLVSVFFVNFYVGPLVALTQRSLASARDLQIATEIQTSVLPKNIDVPGLDVATTMLPASEVGGDYYDIIRVEDGAWIAIGDVSGHGLQAGLIMLMVQSTVSALVRNGPQSRPSDVLCLVNKALFENIRQRMGGHDFVTCTLIRYHADGRMVFAGAHEEILVCRAETGRCESIATGGTWLGVSGDARRVTHDSTAALAEGDLLVLYTDGVTEARNAQGEVFGSERLIAIIESQREAPVAQVRDAITRAVQAWMVTQDDDISVVVARRAARVGPALDAAPA